MKSSSPVAAPQTFHWSSIESPDYREYISNLQAIGCPEKTIRDIIVADVEQLYAAKMPRQNTARPWHNASRRNADARDHILARAALDVEKRALIRELIGYEWDNSANELWHQDSMIALLLGFLPEEKVVKVMSISATYLERGRALKEAAGWLLTDEDRAELQTLYDGLMRDLTQLLSPYEREELELRVQAGGFLAAENICWDGVEIFGNDLREFVRISRRFKAVFAEEFLSPRALSEKQQIEKRIAFEAEVNGLLGPTRFAQFRRAQDQGFRDLLHFTRERNISGEVAINIYETCKSADLKICEAASATDLSNEERTLAVALLKTDTEKFVARRLGNAYAEFLNGPAQWISFLKREPGTEEAR